jgi:hypothetical protein
MQCLTLEKSEKVTTDSRITIIIFISPIIMTQENHQDSSNPGFPTGGQGA